MIATPEVFKSANSDCYIVFGEAKVSGTFCRVSVTKSNPHNQIEDMNSSAQLSAAQHLASSGAGVSALTDKPAGGDNEDDDDIPELEAAVEEEGPTDETGVDPKDIDLVMQQVGCSRAKAVRVLKESGGDLINASTCHTWCLLVKAADCNSSYGRQRVKALHRYVHYPIHDSPPPPTDFDVIIRPLPPTLHNFDALTIRGIRLTPNCKIQLLCSSHCQLVKFALGEHVVISVEHRARFLSTVDLYGCLDSTRIFLRRFSLSSRFLCCQNPRHQDILASVPSSWALAGDDSL